MLILEVDGGVKFGIASRAVPGQKLAPQISPVSLGEVEMFNTSVKTFVALLMVELVRSETASLPDESTEN